MFSCMHIAPGQEQTTPWWQSFDINRKPRSLWPFVAPLWPFVASLKKISEFWFYTHFLMFFPHVYSPGAGANNPLWTKFWCQQKGLVTLPICCKFQKHTFEVWFYTYFSCFLYMYIAPGQGQTTPWGQNFYFNINFLSLWSFAVSSIKWLSNSFSPHKSIRDQIWSCCKIGQGQPRAIIWTNYDGPESPMLHTKPKGNWPFGSGEEDFWRVFTIYGCGGHLGHVTHTPQTNFRSPNPLRLHMKFGFNWPSGFREKDLWKWWTMDHGYTISSPMSHKAQVS